MGSFPETLIDLKSVTSKYPISDNPPRARRSFAPSQDTTPKLQFLCANKKTWFSCSRKSVDIPRVYL